MKIAMLQGKIILAEIDPVRMERFERVGMLKWNKSSRTYTGTVSLDLLNTLSQIFRLPDAIEAERQHLAQTAAAIEQQRMTAEPKPLVEYPVKATLFRHQIRAANMAMLVFTNSPTPSAGFGLLFEMGCGKTLTAIAIMGALYQQDKIRRVLVVAPSSVCSVWPHDLDSFAGFPYDVEVMLGEKKKRLDALQRLIQPERRRKLEIAVINYESTHRDGIFEALSDYAADLIICDESQRIKTHTAAQSKAMHRLGDAARYKLILSGTPVQNNAVDLYSQYRFLDPAVFGTNFYAFRNRYCIMGGYCNRQIVDYQHMEQLIKKEHSIAYRVTKKECLDLPQQTFEKRYVRFDAKEQRLYEQIQKSSVVELEGGDSITATIVLTKLLRLMQLTGGYIKTDDADNAQQVGTSKLDALSDILDDYVLETGQKLVIFARFRPEIDAIEKLLKKKGIQYGSIYGEVSMEDRGKIVEDFQQNPETKVFVAQIQTAGLGITLHAASVAVFYSLDYNYANYAQALARIHRIGQHEPVTYIHLLVENSIDDKVLAALEKKEDIARSIVDNWRDFF